MDQKLKPATERIIPVTAPGLKALKSEGRKIVMVTAYDFPSAYIVDNAGVDVVLVGDSVMLALGYSTTVPVTMDQMLHHAKAVRAGIKRALMVVDMPFGSYQSDVREAMTNAFRLMKEAGAQAVKLEGGAHMVDTVRQMHASGIPVMGHLGLTPQSVNVFGGNRVQGREPEAAEQMLQDALALESAGAFGIVLETIPAALAGQISQALTIPTIGIGSGPACDGQVQVWYDLLGIYPGKKFRHVKRYAEIGSQMEEAISAYAEDVRRGVFPTKENSIT